MGTSSIKLNAGWQSIKAGPATIDLLASSDGLLYWVGIVEPNAGDIAMGLGIFDNELVKIGAGESLLVCGASYCSWSDA